QVRVEAKDAGVALTNLTSADVRLDPDIVFGWVPPALAEGPERHAELALGSPYEAELRYELRPPDGFVPDKLPALADAVAGPARLERSAEARRDGMVAVRYRFSLPKARWTSAEVAGFRKAYAALRAETAPHVTFVHEGLKLVRERRTGEGLALFRR